MGQFPVYNRDQFMRMGLGVRIPGVTQYGLTARIRLQNKL